VETRRHIARSANTGISGIINQRGDVVVQSEWWKEATIKDDILNEKGSPFMWFTEIISGVYPCLYQPC
jgi:apolipoprotein N-acyltransferase